MNFGELFTSIVILAILTETIVQNLKPLYEKLEEKLSEKGFSVDPYLALVIACGLSVGAGYDVLVEVGFQLENFHPIVGQVLTGILASRGSNVVHQLLEGIYTKLLELKLRTAEQVQDLKREA